MTNIDGTRPPEPRALRRRHSIARLIGALAVLAATALLAGFVAFSANLPKADHGVSESAQGIVALTGDAARVRDAVALLAAGRARRLLITGVNRKTTRPEIAAETPGFRYLFKCCIDLGYEAVNTLGNAAEARQWAQREGFRRSLIIVTSTYHMPRALAEMSAAMPGVDLIPYPVATPLLSARTWWRDPQSLRLLGREYVKYLIAVARMALERESPVWAKRSAALPLVLAPASLA
ncbi:MAG TPA: YdcF family protein [Beijerinckiaceae bacterium]|nr:YdcF family protein [Beijerinckiaceae bacterium]HVB89083.1 YdcF family protein [Beijerinckiaceae bacterium]